MALHLTAMRTSLDCMLSQGVHSGFMTQCHTSILDERKSGGHAKGIIRKWYYGSNGQKGEKGRDGAMHL